MQTKIHSIKCDKFTLVCLHVLMFVLTLSTYWLIPPNMDPFRSNKKHLIFYRVTKGPEDQVLWYVLIQDYYTYKFHINIYISWNIFQQCDLVKKIRDNCRKYCLI